MDRNCNKCVWHTDGNCKKWDCEYKTVEDIRTEVISQLVSKIEVNMPIELDERERYGYTVALTIVLEQLKDSK